MYLRYLHALLLVASIVGIHGIEYIAFPDLLDELQGGLSSCVGPCLLEEAWQLQQEVAGEDGPYSLCLDHLGTLLPASFTDAEQFFDFLTVFEESDNCASLNSTLDCLVDLFTQRCGTGLEDPLTALANKVKAFLSCGAATDGTSCMLGQLSAGTLVDGGETDVDGGDIDPSDGPFDLDEELEFTCSSGYRFGQESHHAESTVTLRCTRTGWNATQVPQCQPVHCGAIPVVANGYVSSSTTATGALSPTTLTYTCDAGFTISSTSTDATCQADGTWSQTPTCTAVVCAALGAVTNSPETVETVIVRGSGTDHGTVIEFKCESPAAVLQGPYSDNPFRVCTEDWQPGPDLPMCVPRSCLLPPIYNAEAWSDAKLNIRETVSVTCSPGFEPDGPSNITCSDTTLTLSQIPTCIDIKECTLETDGCGDMCIETTGSFLCTCPDDQTLDPDGKTCTAFDPCSPTDLCRDGTCMPSGVTYTCTCPADRVLFTADGDEGFAIPPSEVGMDTINNTRRLNHTCVRRQCTFDNMLANGYLLNYKPTYHSGDMVSFRCAKGFILQGDVTLTCDNTGAWSASFPTCEAATCTIPADSDVVFPPQYAVCSICDTLPSGSTVQYGDTVTVTCTAGRPGNDPFDTTRTCLYNFLTGTYTLGQDEPYDCAGVRIVCDPPYTDVYVGDGDLQPVVEVVQEENVYGAMYDIVCNNNVPVQNDQQVTCGADGKWQLGTAICAAPVVQCGDPGGPFDSTQMISNSYVAGSTVQFNCPQQGFVLDPSTIGILTCDGDSWQANGQLSNLRCADNEPPTFTTCPADQTSALYDQIDLDLTNIATDNYGGAVNVTANFTPHFVYGARITQTTAVTLVATTPNNPIAPGESADCNYTITVQDIPDTIVPIVICPVSFQYYTTAVSPTSVTVAEALSQANKISPTATDDVSGVLSVTTSATSFMASSDNVNEVTIVTATATDDAGNTGMCKYAIVVRPGCAAWAIATPANASKVCVEVTDGTVLQCTITCDEDFYMHDSQGGSTQGFRCQLATHTWLNTDRVFDCLAPRQSKGMFTASLLYYGGGTENTVCTTQYMTSLESAYDNFLTANPKCPQTPNSGVGDISLSQPDPSENTIAESDDGPREAQITILLSRSPTDAQDVNFDLCKDNLIEAINNGTHFKQLSGANCVDVNLGGTTLLSLTMSCFPWEVETPTQRCVPCPSGTYTDRNLSTGSCMNCPVGEFSTTADVDSCTACPTAGQVTRREGTQEVLECLDPCSVYHQDLFLGVSSTGHMPCSECPLDQAVSTVTPDTTCVACDGNNCLIECGPGDYSTTGTGFEPCDPCPEGFYNENTRRASCSECNYEQLTVSTGSSAAADCRGVSANNPCNPPCENGGTCEIQAHIHVCLCPAGTTGSTCNAFTACDSNPCRNGGGCTATTNSFSCACTSGYNGVMCTETNFCSQLDCGTDGECQEVAPAGKCICKPGYTGANCEFPPVDPCTPDPCQHGATCNDMGGIRSECTCPAGYTGVNCQTDINECISNPCLNGGECSNNTNAWSCTCTSFFTGTDCGTPTATCVDPDTSCAGGRCIPDSWEGGEKCVCPPGYDVASPCPDGTWCAGFTSVSTACAYQDPCANNPCQNGGTCSDTDPLSDMYMCTCISGYTGLSCQIIESDFNLFDCPTNNCVNGGTCKVNTDETTTCLCADGWTGSTCADDLDECASNPCVEGTCVNDDNFYSCTCTAGHFGLQCETNIDECESTPCYHGGTCIDGVNEYMCQCVDGWTGANCNTLVTTCTSSPCQNSAPCTDVVNHTFCLCPARTSGVYCDAVPDLCVNANPCVGGGACTHTVGQGVTCDCAQASVGRVGTFCETERDFCGEFQTSPCKWSKRCVTESTSYTCQGRNKFCLLDPVSYDTASSSSLYSCYDTYYQSLGTLVDTTFTNEQGFTALLTTIAQQSCGSIDTMIQCMKDTLTYTLGGCEDEETELMDLLYIPTLAYFKELGNCDHALLNSIPVDNCRCLQGYTVDTNVFGTCNITFTETLVQIQVGINWTDDLAGSTCEERPLFHVICEMVEQVARNLTISSRIRFQGLSPTSSGKVNVTFSANNLRESFIQNWVSNITRLVSKKLIVSTPVSQHLNIITQIPGQIRIQDVHPNFGPESGATRISITGYNLDEVLVTNVGDLQCIRQHRDKVLIICQTPALTDSDLVADFLNVTVFVTDQPTFTGEVFAYRPDPVISSVEPLATIRSGGTVLTVNGQHFDSVDKPVMRTTIELRSDPTQRVTYRTPCTVVTPTVMHCVTPFINLQDLQSGRRRRDVTRQGRQAGVQTLNDMEEIDVHIGFELDGVLTYRNLTGGGLDRYSQLTVYQDPVIKSFGPPQQFISTWPVGDRQMEIDGENLNLALKASDITVKVGLAICEKMQLFANKIICEPPVKRPEVGDDDTDPDDQKIPIKVQFAEQVFTVGDLFYIQTVWEYEPTRYGIIGGLCGLVFVIALIVLICFLWRRGYFRGGRFHNDSYNQTGKGYETRGRHHFRSYIPRAARGGTPSYYTGSMGSGAGYNLFRGGTGRSFYP